MFYSVLRELKYQRQNEKSGFILCNITTEKLKQKVSSEIVKYVVKFQFDRK